MAAIGHPQRVLYIDARGPDREPPHQPQPAADAAPDTSPGLAGVGAPAGAALVDLFDMPTAPAASRGAAADG